MCRICHASRFITMYTTNKQQSHDAKLRREQRSEVSELAAAATVGTHDAATSSQRIHVPTVDKSGNQPRKEILGKQLTFQPSGVCRVAFCKMFSSGRKLCRVSGLAQASKITVSTFEGLSSCPKEYTDLRGLLNLKIRADLQSTSDKVTHRHPERGFRTTNLLCAPSIAVTKCTRSYLPLKSTVYVTKPGVILPVMRSILSPL